MQLKSGTLLQGGKYRIEKVLGQGGFGITYLAVQTNLNRKVAIKEFFMKEHCNRDADTSDMNVPSTGSKELVAKFKSKFIKEAQTIAELDNVHIVPVYDVFEENGTAYYVMKYIAGGSLNSLVNRGEVMPMDLALNYVSQVADALAYCHERNIAHLDVKPGNILIQDGVAVLIDFGISKHYNEDGDQTSSTPVGISKGYAPLEQYKRGGVTTFSPVTDIYSLGAVLYRLLTGQTPPYADEVNEEGLPEFPSEIPQYICEAITAAMQPKKKDRPQSVDDFLAMLVEPAVDDWDDDSEDTIITSAVDDRKHNEILYINGILNVKGIKYPMVYVDGGGFDMGSNGIDAFENEKPVHRVRLSSYRIGKYEVTQDIWEAVMGTNPSEFKGPRRPVENVSWDDCQEFIRKLNSLTGQNFKLPTEAQWEFAARGGNNSRGYKYSGSDNIESVAWYDNNSGDATHDVGNKASNELGIYDMSGNVAEWCSDWDGSYSRGYQSDPKGPSSSFRRVSRGGNWRSFARWCRVSGRGYATPDFRNSGLGLRLCL